MQVYLHKYLDLRNISFLQVVTILWKYLNKLLLASLFASDDWSK